jgi:hypothetical protein
MFSTHVRSHVVLIPALSLIDVILTGHKYRLYVEFVKPPYAANLRWAFHPSEGVEHAFRINVNGEYNISIQNESVPFSNLKTTGTMNVQWLEDQVMIITLSEDPNDASKYNINLTSFNSKDSRFDHLLLPVE